MLLINFYKNHLKFDIINKFNYSSLLKLPKLNKICVNFICINYDILFLIVLLIKIICKKKINNNINKKNINLVFKIKKGKTFCCYIFLHNFLREKFFYFLIIKILPISQKLNNLLFEFEINNLFLLKKLNINTQLPKIKIIIIFINNSNKNKKYINKNFKLLI